MRLDTNHAAIFSPDCISSRLAMFRPLGPSAHVGNLMHAPDINAPGVGEEHQIIMRLAVKRCSMKSSGPALHDRFLAGTHADHALATRRWAGMTDIGALDQAIVRESDDDTLLAIDPRSPCRPRREQCRCGAAWRTCP
ncbi:MAG: hypothetical protein Ct9H300mP32_0260 [Verrucomicrobiota bacterium]|nr:MAG: hypothetical protein Ct9H300mP32_0260 [Verrucomicrobiota bacterium]